MCLGSIQALEVSGGVLEGFRDRVKGYEDRFLVQWGIGFRDAG